MKIAIVSDYFQPTIGYAKVQVAKNLMELGHKVKIITSDRYFPFHNYESTTKKLLGNRIRSVGTKKENNFTVERKEILFEGFTRVFIPNIKEAIKNYKPDIVIVFGISTFTCFQISQLKKLLGFKLVIADSHLPSEFNSGNLLLKKIFYFIFRILFSKKIKSASDKVIAMQDQTKNIITDIYGIKKNIEVIPNGTDTQLFRFSKKERKVLRKKLDIPDSDFILIYTGKIIEQKGLEILFKAFSLLTKTNKKIHLLLVGSGPEEYIEKCYNKVPKTFLNQIHLVGFQNQEELYKYYSASDLAVWPLQESLAMNDAAACSLPFIANDTMGDKTRVSNNNAVLYKKDNSNDLAKQINKLIKNTQLRNKMGRNGRKLMVEKLSWKELSKRFL